MSTEGLAGFYIETRNYGATAAGDPRAPKSANNFPPVAVATDPESSRTM